MQLSRGWYGLLFFWTAVVVLCGAGAGALQVLGPPTSARTSALVPLADPVLAEFAERVPATSLPPASVSEPAFEVADAGAKTADAAPRAETGPPAMLLAAATIPLADHEPAPPDTEVAAREPDEPVATDAGHEARQPAKQDPQPPARKLHLRIVRDDGRCPQKACYKWHVLDRRQKLPHATLDLATLRLAPSIRQAVENGEAELIVDAVEQHKTIHGHDRVVIVATNLAGVMPHDGPFAAIAASGP
jgi:hypothetical protein